jgi:hypothetical protein
MQGKNNALKSPICGGGAVKRLTSHSCGAGNRFAMGLQWVCGNPGRLWESSILLKKEIAEIFV